MASLPIDTYRATPAEAAAVMARVMHRKAPSGFLSPIKRRLRAPLNTPVGRAPFEADGESHCRSSVGDYRTGIVTPDVDSRGLAIVRALMARRAAVEAAQAQRVAA